MWTAILPCINSANLLRLVVWPHHIESLYPKLTEKQRMQWRLAKLWWRKKGASNTDFLWAVGMEKYPGVLRIGIRLCKVFRRRNPELYYQWKEDLYEQVHYLMWKEDRESAWKKASPSTMIEGPSELVELQNGTQSRCNCQDRSLDQGIVEKERKVVQSESSRQSLPTGKQTTHKDRWAVPGRTVNRSSQIHMMKITIRDLGLQQLRRSTRVRRLPIRFRD
jgi:hypothetical protein